MPWLHLQGGRRLWYEEQGEGRPLLLLHGWCMSSRVWSFQLESLRDEFRVIAPDLAGHGNSDPAPELFTLPTLRSDLEMLFRRLDLRDTLVAGWSLGGQLALLGVAGLRERLAGLVLVATTPRFTRGDGFVHGLDPRELRGMQARMRRNPGAMFQEFVSSLFTEQERAEPSVYDAVERLLASIPLPEIQTALQGLRILAEADLRPLLSDVDLPTLVVGGDRDAICLPPASAYLARNIRGSRQLLFQGGGHAPFLTRSGEFNNAITSFSRRMFEKRR